MPAREGAKQHKHNNRSEGKMKKDYNVSAWCFPNQDAFNCLCDLHDVEAQKKGVRNLGCPSPLFTTLIFASDRIEAQAPTVKLEAASRAVSVWHLS